MMVQVRGMLIASGKVISYPIVVYAESKGR